jgi:hypothetical protein
MKKLYFLDEEEKNRILNIHEGATKRQYLSEQTLSVDEQIAKQFYDTGALGMGTNPDEMFNALNKITSAEQFWKVNELVKNRPKNSDKLDIAGVINDEFEYSNTTAGASDSNTQDLDKIITKLTTLGITSTIKKSPSGANYVDNTFVITSQPITTSTNTDWTACVKQFGGTMETSSDPTWVSVPLKSDKVGNSMWFKNDYNAMYRPGGGAQEIKGTWACTGNKLTIKLDDKWTWGDGKWNDPNKAAVVDPKVAYQQRAKQTTDTTKQIQQALGVETPSGVLDSAEVETMINTLKQ